MTFLRETPVRAITASISSAAERWSDADFPPRVRAAERIAQRTGYSLPMVDYALDRLFFEIREDRLHATIAGELGSLDVVDGFRARAGRPDAWASPAGNVCVISSRTTIGVAIPPAIFALCAKNDVLVKDREDALVHAFFQTLSEELDVFSQAAQARTWSSLDGDSEDLERFDVVAAFGGDASLRGIRQRLAAHTTFLGYGSRASAGYVTRESLAGDAQLGHIVNGAARDVVLYDSEGCLSLHVLFCERGGAVSPSEFGRRLAGAIAYAGVEFPVGDRHAAMSARLAHQRDLAVFRAASKNGTLFAAEDARYAVFVDYPSSEPPAFLPRTVGILGVDAPAEACRYLRRHRIPLEGFALSQARDDVVRAVIESGAVRLARFGELQHPPLTGDHGGRPRIAQFVRWIDRTL